MTLMNAATRCLRWMGRLAWIGLAAWMTACSHYEESGLPGSAAALARDKMMLVREEPPSFGSYRMHTLMETYPAIRGFIEDHGMPDFLAETRHERYEYLILYYLGRREAHACKVGLGWSREVEFSGPYPVTDSEYKVLDGFRADQR